MAAKIRLVSALVGAAVLLAPTALADLSQISNVIFRIEATNASGTGYLEFTRDQLTYNPLNDSYTWSTGAIPIFDNEFDLIATLTNAQVAIRVDGVKKIGGAFAVQAGTTITTFVITLAQLTFNTLPPNVAEGRLGLAANVTDVGGGGVTMQALGAPGTGMLRGDYNGMVPLGTMFGQALWRVQASSGSASGFQNVPAAGYAAIPNPVSDMNSRIAFTLTPNDLAGGTHYFEIIPEPASLILCAICAGLLYRRR
jgi:hypothetical protein